MGKRRVTSLSHNQELSLRKKLKLLPCKNQVECSPIWQVFRECITKFMQGKGDRIKDVNFIHYLARLNAVLHQFKAIFFKKCWHWKLYEFTGSPLSIWLKTEISENWTREKMNAHHHVALWINRQIPGQLVLIFEFKGLKIMHFWTKVTKYLATIDGSGAFVIGAYLRSAYSFQLYGRAWKQVRADDILKRRAFATYLCSSALNCQNTLQSTCLK